MTLSELDRNLIEWAHWARADPWMLDYPPVTPMWRLMGRGKPADDLPPSGGRLRAQLTLREHDDDNDDPGFDPDRAWTTDCWLRLFRLRDPRHFFPLVDSYYRRMAVEALKLGECLRLMRDFIDRRSCVDVRLEVRKIRAESGIR